MITHIERPILAAALTKIYASNAMMISEHRLISSIIKEINQNKNVINLDRDESNALIGILKKHADIHNEI